MTERFRIRDLIGLHQLIVSPKLTNEEVDKKCSMFGRSWVLYPDNANYLPRHLVSDLLATQGIQLASDDLIRETLYIFGSPLPNRDLSEIEGYIRRARNIVADEFGEELDFQLELVRGVKKYGEESHKRMFLCSSIYEGVMIEAGRKDAEKPDKSVQLVRVAPTIGAFLSHGNSCEYMLFALDQGLFQAAFSEPIHSLTHNFTGKAMGEKQSLDFCILDETFVEGAAEVLFGENRDSLHVPKTFTGIPLSDRKYQYYSASRRWIEKNGLRTAWDLYKEDPRRYFEAVKAEI